MSQPTLRFHFDYVSPKAYLAWAQLPWSTDQRSVKVDAIPVLFGAILHTQSQLGPAQIPAKMRWMVRDIVRKAGQLGLRLSHPVSYPFNPLLALRASSLPALGEKQSALISAIFDAVWVSRVNVSDPPSLAKVIESIGPPADTLLTQAASDAARNSLRVHTDEAIAAGVFGVPSMLVDGNLFWEFDDFGHLGAFLDGEAAVNSDLSSREDLIGSAHRTSAS